MRYQRIVFVFLIMGGVYWGAAFGQLPRGNTAPWGTPGVSRGDRFFGFVPQHLKSQNLKIQTPASLHRGNENTVGLASLAADTRSEVVVTGDSGDLLVDSPWCAPGVECAAFPMVWVRADYLLWSTKGMDAPPLITTSPNGTAQSEAGVLGRPGTSILFGSSGLNGDARSGGRITLGMWLDPCQTQGLDVTYIGLDDESETFFASDGGFSILARPFFNVQTGLQDARLIVFPNIVEGAVALRTSTDFQAAEVMVRRVISRSGCSQLAYVLGYRYAELEDQLRVTESTLSLSGATSGTTFELLDQFTTKNSFHGGELGLKYTWQRYCGWSMDLVAKVAFGSTRLQAQVLGQTTTTPPTGGVVVTQAGLLAQSTNSGVYENNEFSTVSEFAVTLRKQLTCRLAATIGYDLFYWSDVWRGAEQIDLGINPSQIPPGTLVGEARPLFPFNPSDFWAQGLHVGIEYWF